MSVKEIEDPIFVAYYPAGQAKVSQGHVAMWYRDVKVDVAPVFDNPHSVMSGDMIYGEVCEKPMFDTSSGKDICYIYMLDPKNIGMRTEEDCQRVLNRMVKGINNTRSKDNNLSKDYYHGLTNNCVSAVLKSLDGYVLDRGIDSPYTLSNTLSELVDKGKATRLSVDTFNQYVANRWKEKSVQQEKKNINKINLWENAFLSDDKLEAFFERNLDLEQEFMQSRKLSPLDTPAKNMEYKREFLLRKNQKFADIIDASFEDIETLFKNKPELEEEYRYWRKSSPMDSQFDVINHKKRFLIEKEVKQQYSGDVQDINLDFLTFPDNIVQYLKYSIDSIPSNVLNALNKYADVVENQQVPSLSVDECACKIENVDTEMILSNSVNKQYSK